MDFKLKYIFDRCKASVEIEQNQHKDYYQSPQEWFNENSRLLDDMPSEVVSECIKRDNIITFQCYPDTPIGFHFIVDYDLERIIDKMYDILKEEL